MIKKIIKSKSKKGLALRLGFFAMLALMLFGAFGLAACGISPTTRHNGRMQSGTVVVMDFDITAGTALSFAAAQTAWDNAGGGGNTLVAKTARAMLPFRPGSDGLNLSFFNSYDLDGATHARLFFNDGVDMFGDVNWSQTTANSVTNQLSQGQGFYVAANATASAPTSTVIQMGSWFAIPLTILAGTSGGMFSQVVENHWDMADSSLTGVAFTNALVARRRVMVAAINNFIVPLDLRVAGYSLAFSDTQLAIPSLMFPLWIGGAFTGQDVWINPFTVSRFVRLTLATNPRVYFARGRVNDLTIETTHYGSWNADASGLTTGAVFVSSTRGESLRPMVRITDRMTLELGDMPITVGSSYVDGQLYSIWFESMFDWVELNFIINRP